MTAPALLTVLLNYRTAPLTLRAAEAAVRGMDGLAGEIVIVDNDSRDGSFRMLSDAVSQRGWDAGNRVRVLQAGRNGGFGAGNNVGIRAGLSNGARPDFVYVLNSDAFPDPGAIRALLDFLQRHPRAGCAGSHVRGEDDVPHTTLFRFPSIASDFETAARTGPVTRLLRHAVLPLPIPDAPRRVGWTAGASLMMRMDMLDRIGLFDETFFLYFEETELCHRAAMAGYERWFVPQSRVMHIGSASTGMKRWERIPQYFLDSRRHYFTKVHGRGYFALATAALLMGGALWRLRCALGSRSVGRPERMMRDVGSHFLRSAFQSSRAPSPKTRPLREESR